MYAQKYPPPPHNQGPGGAPPTSVPMQGTQGFTPIGSDRVADILEQVRSDYAAIETDYNICKRERDEFERKLEQQLGEFQNMKQTIVDLEMNYNSIKQQYEERISNLKQQLDNVLQGTNNPQQQQQQQQQPPQQQTPLPPQQQQPPPPQQQSQPPPPESRITSASPSNTPSFLSKAPQPPPHKRTETPVEAMNPNDSMGRNDSSPYPFPRQSAPSLPPISVGGNSSQGMGGPPPSNGPNSALPPTNNPSNNNNEIPSFNQLQDNRNSNPDHPFGNRPQSNYNTYASSNPSLIASINNINNPQNTDISNTMPMPLGMMDQNGIIKNGKNDNMVKKEGDDWVVVFNPQVQAKINLNLAHNIEQQSVVCCVRFSADGKYMATGSNKQAQIYDVDSGKRVMAFPANPSIEGKKSNGHVSKSHEDDMSDNDDDDKEKDSDGRRGEIDHEDPLSTALGGSFEKEDSYVRSVCFSPDGQYLVAGAEDKTVKVWDMNTRDLKYSFVGHELDIYSLDFSSDSRFIVSGSGDGKTKIWNMESGQCDYTLGNEEIGPKEGVTSVAISPDGRIVAAGSLDCVVRLWDTQTGKFLESFKGHDDSVYSVAFSPDGKTLASGSLDRTLRLWDLSGARTGGYKCISTLSGHRDYVLSVAFSPDGKWLMSGSKDRSVQFWDPRSNILHLMLQGHKNSVISVALNPVRHMFATGSGDFRARVWQWS